MKKFVYFSDIDGTMINQDPGTLNSLGKTIEESTVIPVTGRYPHGFEKDLQSLLPKNTGVFANGALCLYQNGVTERIVDKKIGSEGHDGICSLLEVLNKNGIQVSLKYNEVVGVTTGDLLQFMQSNKNQVIDSNIVYLCFEKERKEAILDILRDGGYPLHTSLNDASLLITPEGADKGTGLSAFVDFLLDKKIINKEEHSLFFGGNDYNDGPIFKMDNIQGMALQKAFVGNHPLKEELQKSPELYPNMEFFPTIADYHSYLKSLLSK